jgi:hypothetical protein
MSEDIKMPLPSSLQEIIGSLLFASNVPLTIADLRESIRAVECEAGENNIVFEYSTPGLLKSTTLVLSEKEFTVPGGVWISLVAIFIYVIYMLYFNVYKKHKAETKFFGFEYYDDCGISYTKSNTRKIPLKKRIKKLFKK